MVGNSNTLKLVLKYRTFMLTKVFSVIYHIPSPPKRYFNTIALKYFSTYHPDFYLTS